jgi:O-antigen/teichoic acid export membrane protein
LFTALFADVALVVAAPLLTKADAAGFGLSLKLAFLVGFVVQASHQIAAPDLADARQSGNPAAMQAALAKGTVFPSAASAVALFAVAIAGPTFLGIFNPEFGQYHAVLVVLVATQFIRALAGPSTQLLTLSGAQGLNAGLSVFGVLVLASGMVILVPSLGALGAALAVLFTYLVWIVTTAVALRRLKERRTDLAGLFFRPASLVGPSGSGRPNHPIDART